MKAEAIPPACEARVACAPPCGPASAAPALDEADAVRAMAALAQAQRLRVFRSLVAAGPRGLHPGELTARLGIAPSTLSFHLKELMAAALVSQERTGRHLLYRPEIGRMNGLIDYLGAHCCEAEAPVGPAPADPAAPPTIAWSHAMNHPSRPHRYNALFICSHNSARSILAEAILQHLAPTRFQAFSAGSHPSGHIQPLALRTLEHLHIPFDGLRSKDWAEFAQPDAPVMDFVFTVCDRAAGEACPVWPGQPLTAHWGVADPALAEGSELQREQAFREAAITLKRRIELMLALPIESLDRMALQSELRELGKR